MQKRKLKLASFFLQSVLLKKKSKKSNLYWTETKQKFILTWVEKNKDKDKYNLF